MSRGLILGQDDAALAGYEHYVTIDPKNAYVQYQIGEIHMDRRDLARAEAAFAQALSIDPKLASARVATGVLAFERGQLPQAEQLLQEALTLKPDVSSRTTIWRSWPRCAATTRPPRRRIAPSSSATRPRSRRRSFNLGRLKARQGQVREATAWYQQSIDTNAEFAEGYFYLAKAKLDEGRELDQAVSLARTGLALQPEGETSPLGHFVIGGVLMKQGRPAEAERELARGLALEARLAKRP